MEKVGQAHGGAVVLPGLPPPGRTSRRSRLLLRRDAVAGVAHRQPHLVPLRGDTHLHHTPLRVKRGRWPPVIHHPRIFSASIRTGPAPSS